MLVPQNLFLLNFKNIKLVDYETHKYFDDS